MSITKKQNVSECVTKNYKTAAVFKKYKIDFCCGGKISIQEACRKDKIDEKLLLQELNEIIKKRPQENMVENYELDILVDYIIKKHHAYILKTAPEIDSFLSKIVDVHGQRQPELKKVQEIFQAVKKELLSHMEKEENILFPYIKESVEAKNNNSQLAPPFFGTIKNPINMMEKEHESAGNCFREIRKITNNFTPPDDACNTYRISLSLLDEFENNLHRHIHLENNILFPKAIILENDLS